MAVKMQGWHKRCSKAFSPYLLLPNNNASSPASKNCLPKPVGSPKNWRDSRTELDRLNESALARLLASETPEEFNERWGFVAEHFDLLTSAPEHIAPLRQSILELAVRGKLTRREAGDESAKELLKRIKEEKQNSLKMEKSRKRNHFHQSKKMKNHLNCQKDGNGQGLNDLCTHDH